MISYYRGLTSKREKIHEEDDGTYYFPFPLG